MYSVVYGVVVVYYHFSKEAVVSSGVSDKGLGTGNGVRGGGALSSQVTRPLGYLHTQRHAHVHSCPGGAGDLQFLSALMKATGAP